MTADRRLKESNAIRAIVDVLPISRPQLEKANQNSLLALTANYMRVRKLLEQKGKTISERACSTTSWQWPKPDPLIMLSVCLPVCLSACLSVCLSVCLCAVDMKSLSMEEQLVRRGVVTT